MQYFKNFLEYSSVSIYIWVIICTFLSVVYEFFLSCHTFVGILIAHLSYLFSNACPLN